MYIKIVGILVLILFIGCKDDKDKEKVRVGSADESIAAEAAKLAEEVSKSTGKSADEAKSLSKDELGQLTDEARSSAEAALKSAEERVGIRDRSDVIKQITEAAGKLVLAFRSLVRSGYSSDIVEPFLENMKHALGQLSLAGKLATMAESINQTLDSALEAVVKLEGDLGSCIKHIKANSDQTDAPSSGLNLCVKDLMENAGSYFHDNVRDLIAGVNVPDKFKDALENLQAAAHFIGRATLMLNYKD
ncbi:hypothetical protein [Borrelia sp. P9F1]|uniref:hypothetical protein n=1 Tax=Borrelia sp. P9F1 TaxID=3058374 RepID=UPI00264993A1|nr:hypothetical protein [Borrelia sp. P9F1]WKC58504.1 hypothetical protein QYZ68_04815 [Borrelia sp. P9F1]